MNRRNSIKVILQLVIVSACFLGYSLHYQSSIFGEFQESQRSVDWMLLVCVALWCGAFISVTFSLNDLSLIGLLLIAIGAFFTGYSASQPLVKVFVLLAGVTLGRGAYFALKKTGGNNPEIANRKPAIFNFLVGLVSLLAFSSWWHLEIAYSFYPGTRWTGLWNNPNTYGMLMGAGGLLAIGLLAANSKLKIKNSKTNWFLGIAVFMLGVGLMMSYSRGAWLATAIGLLYLAWSYGKLKWKYVGLGVGLGTLGVLLVWGSTPDSAPWYVKRADLGRPSAQNRATAWRAGLEIMRDHPLGVGWSNATKIYGEKYSPPEGGPGALTTNDYLMIGTELGIPALVCFVVYVALCYRKSPRIQKLEVRSQELESALSSRPFPPTGEKEQIADPASSIPHLASFQEGEALRAACLAGALVFLVAFWFDGGLFKLPTAALFWVLLELGSSHPKFVSLPTGDLVAANNR